MASQLADKEWSDKRLALDGAVTGHCDSAYGLFLLIIHAGLGRQVSHLTRVYQCLGPAITVFLAQASTTRLTYFW
jgi:hypothetical protein